MTDATAIPVWPTSREIAVAIVAAARIRSEVDPCAIADGSSTGSKARWLALAALNEAFPSVPLLALAPYCGVAACAAPTARSALGRYRSRTWFRSADLGTVKAALAAATAEADAELRKQVPEPTPAPAPIVQPHIIPEPPALQLSRADPVVKRVPNGTGPIVPMAERVARVHRQEIARRADAAQASAFTGSGGTGFDLNMRPDRPPEKRGVVVVTAALMGDPTPQDRARREAAAPLIAEAEEEERRLSKESRARLTERRS